MDYSENKPFASDVCNVCYSVGFVPNGGRTYFLNRSQPPLLIPMVAIYLKATNDTQFLKDNIGALQQVYNCAQITR